MIDQTTTAAQFQALVTRERVKKNLSAKEISLDELKDIIKQSKDPQDIYEPHVADHQVDEDYITIVLTSKSKYDSAPKVTI